MALLAEAPKRGAAAGRPLGDHPDDGKPVTQGKGRFGPYVKHLRLYASIPSDIDPESITLEQALPLLAAQAEKKAQKAAKKPAAKKKAASKKKAATKKASKKKPASAKKAAKKAPARKKAVTTTASN